MNSKATNPRTYFPMMGRRWISGSALLLACCFVNGCGTSNGPPRAAVEGSVLLNGLPMPAGVIRFIPQGDTTGPMASAKIEVGHFELPAWTGPIVGEHRVEIELRDDGGIAPDDEEAMQRLASLPKDQRPTLKVKRIPECYNRRSELVAQIVPKTTNALTFELVSAR